jgi:hypothetical protein
MTRDTTSLQICHVTMNPEGCRAVSCLSPYIVPWMRLIKAEGAANLTVDKLRACLGSDTVPEQLCSLFPIQLHQATLAAAHHLTAAVSRV